MHDRALTWGDVVAHRRRTLGLRQDELAALAGVATRSVHAIEHGKPTVRLDVLVAVLDALGLSLTVSGSDTAARVELRADRDQSA